MPVPYTASPTWASTVGVPSSKGSTFDLAGEEREAEEHHAEPDAHDHEGLPGVLPRRLLERGDAVGDRLDAGDRGAAGGERLGEHVGGGAVEEPVGRAHRAPRAVDDALGVLGDRGEVAAEVLHEARTTSSTPMLSMKK